MLRTTHMRKISMRLEEKKKNNMIAFIVREDM